MYGAEARKMKPDRVDHSELVTDMFNLNPTGRSPPQSTLLEVFIQTRLRPSDLGYPATFNKMWGTAHT